MACVLGRGCSVSAPHPSWLQARNPGVPDIRLFSLTSSLSPGSEHSSISMCPLCPLPFLDHSSLPLEQPPPFSLSIFHHFILTAFTPTNPSYLGSMALCQESLLQVPKLSLLHSCSPLAPSFSLVAPSHSGMYLSYESI